MKKVVILLPLVLGFILVNAQVPQGFNYQAIARDGSGNPIAGATIQVMIGILSDTLAQTVVWEELHNQVKTNSFGLFTLVIGTGERQSGSALFFNDINWNVTPLYLKTQINHSGTFKYMGSAQLWSVPYSMIAGDLEGSVKKLSVVGDNTLSDEALFEVKRKDGETIFAVYNHGVRVYMPLDTLSKARRGGFAIGGFDKAKGTVQDYFVVNPDSIRAYIDTNTGKAKRGGFAIGGFDRAKASNEEYLRVTRDSTRFYLNDTGAKGRRGGFAIGGFDKAKGNIQDFMTVSSDSIRMYIDDIPAKGVRGGFAIGGFDRAKAGNSNFLNVAIDTTGIIYPSQNRVQWYPLKNALLAGKVLAQHKDSIGENSFSTGFESKAMGKYSQALGYKAIARGDYSTAIGRNAIANYINSFAMGENAKALYEETYAFGSNSRATGKGSVAIGFNSSATGWDAFALGAGTQATGLGSFALGFEGRDSSDISTGGTTASLRYGVAIGMGAQSVNSLLPSNKGAFSIGIQTRSEGNYSFALGYRTRSSGWYSFAAGYGTTASGNFSTAMGFNSIASGSHAVAIGQGSSASNLYSVAFGPMTSSEGQQSFSFGGETKAIGNYSLAMGRLSKATGTGSVSIGFNNEAMLYATAIGYETHGTGDYSTSTGFRTIAGGSYSFSAGNQSTATGSGAFAIGSYVKGNGDYSFATGLQTEARGMASTAIGYSAIASGSYSFAGGYQTVAAGSWSVALGQNCSATTWNTFAMGAATTARGYLSTSFGLASKARPFASFAIGQYNDSTCSTGGNTSWVSTDPLLIAGNGSSPTTLSNALTLYKNGNLTISGTLTQNSDLRVKESIEPFLNGYSLIEKIDPVYFYFRDKNIHPAGRQIGFIAQNVRETIPELVYEDGSGYLSVDYSKMSAVLLQVAREQQKQIESQQKEIDELKALVNTIIANQSGQGNK